MIQIIGVDHDVPVVVRERFSVSQKKLGERLKSLKAVFEEVAILSTCNRTEIYFKSRKDYGDIVEQLFYAMNWDIKLKKYIYHLKERMAVDHIMYLSSGFHSVVVGEDQILSQIKSSYESALAEKSIGREFSSLFKKSIRCGKEFRSRSKLYQIPVSSSSIAVSESRRRYAQRYMVIGYGDVGKLTLKYILSSQVEKVYIVVKDGDKIEIDHPAVEIIPYGERIERYGDVDCIISSTSAPHTVVDYEESLRGKLIFDLAVPRDVSDSVYSSHEIEVYNIDMLRKIDSENQKKRQAIMDENRFIVEKYIREFYDWKSTAELSPIILEIQRKSEEVVESRHRTFKNKRESRDVDELARTMIKSTSNVYVNRAIEVMKSEILEGRGEECLEIIKKIFY